jgi:hypothetical protein
MKDVGDIPLAVFRGDVTPPPTTFLRFASCSRTYAGFSSRRTYSVGDTGTEKTRVFGSFQIVQSRTHG